MPRFIYWWRVMRAGWRTVPAIVSFIILITGGSLALALPWGRRHPPWAIADLSLLAVAMIAEGSYQVSRSLERTHEGKLTALQGDHRTELDDLRRAHQAAMDTALAADIASRADTTVKPDPVDWNPTCEYYPGWLSFDLRHRLNNQAAVLAFSAVHCAVTDPDGVRTVAEDQSIIAGHGALLARYTPSCFPGAPPVRSGIYRFKWTGQDAKGHWHEITRGSYEVPLPEAASPRGDGVQS